MRATGHSTLFKWLGLGLLGLGLAFGTGTLVMQHQKQKDMRMLIEKARDAWVARDADAVAQLFTLDGVFIVPGQRWQGQARIHEEATRFAQRYSDVKIDIQRVIIEGNQAVVEWHYEDVETATGRRNRAEDVIIIDVKNGQISRWREYFDTQTPDIQ